MGRFRGYPFDVPMIVCESLKEKLKFIFKKPGGVSETVVSQNQSRPSDWTLKWRSKKIRDIADSFPLSLVWDFKDIPSFQDDIKYI